MANKILKTLTLPNAQGEQVTYDLHPEWDNIEGKPESFSPNLEDENLIGILSPEHGGTGNANGYVQIGAKANTTLGDKATAEGINTTASGYASHAEGLLTTASGHESHAEGYATDANGVASHAEGSWTIANGEAQHAQGKYNIEDTELKYAHIVGNGHIEENGNIVRSNAHTLDWDGNAWYAGRVTVEGSVLTQGSIVIGNTNGIVMLKNAAGTSDPTGYSIGSI